MQDTLPPEETQRLESMMQLETQAKKRGFRCIAGVDEAGRGPLAGPVVAAACVIPEGTLIEGVDDSKKLTPSDRSKLFRAILAIQAIDYGIGIIDTRLIDEINILQATFQAMIAAVFRLSQRPDYLLVDGNKMPQTSIAGEAVVKGDGLSQSIAAASIIAKETRDQLMNQYHEQWPQYGFNIHKGYGTKKHLLALERYGPCPIHRASFEPIKSFLKEFR